MAEPAVLTDSGVSGRRRQRRLVIVLGTGLSAAAVPAAAVFVWFVSALGGGRHVDVLFTVLAVGWTVLTVGVPAVVISRVARRHGVRVPAVAATVLVVAQAAAMVGLDHLAPFRLGLLSALLYGAPAVPLAGGALATAWRGRVVCAVLGAAVFWLAVPVGVWQQAVGAWEWTHAAGVPSRAWLQVINIPGGHQEPYDWDASSRILGGFWDPGGDQAEENWAAVEAVASDRSDMFTAVAWAQDYNTPGDTHCTRQSPDLWQCVNTSVIPAEIAFVRRSAGVLIILTGWDYSPSVLLRSLRAAHPATNPELQARSALAPRSPIGLLLL